jgi:hypothetical protein
LRYFPERLPAIDPSAIAAEVAAAARLVREVML